MTSPLGLLLLHDLLALLSPPFVDGVARVVDLEGVLVVHVGILDFSGLLVKLQNVGHPKSDGERERGGESSKNGGRGSTQSQLCRTFTERTDSALILISQNGKDIPTVLISAAAHEYHVYLTRKRPIEGRGSPGRDTN